ncbi:hypothetical protein L198_07542 [Cryptococcus wingfieldii CBS 7118]|uniref:Ribosome biogenesis protein SLX9 n=1 Tax=Cryptococcus wingfieldii CBS 7118 TaxID=1295528 RepID=A0A1E3ICI3_9TREE|nr:hypothetical protein L198_07542 [Cryptococcus wingfieldii CBS 7118]ODN85461.1 hypothetical protein L198_07542 [Cryptococcus wingfieldii CBS 7118]
MPRVGRAKIRHHAAAVAVQKNQSNDAPEGQPFAAPTPVTEPVAVKEDRTTKKLKGLKVPPEGLEAGKAPHPYFVPSKSHLRRQKRRARDIAGGLSSLENALSSIAPEAAVPNPPASLAINKKTKKDVVKTKEQRDEERRKRLEEERERGKIGEGKGRTLGEKKRRDIIQESAKRIPAVMGHPAFKQNPWAAIREHAGNTLAQK